MKIGLDYDGTITADPLFWRHFVDLAQQHGHECFVVTQRHTLDDIRHLPRGISAYVTRGALKGPFMAQQGIHIDWWIDDMPDVIFGGTRTLQWGT